MCYWRSALMLIFLGSAISWAQNGGRMDEAQETLRFIRLAETKKNLNLDEAKLLKVNDILDEFEAARFDLRKRQGIAYRRVQAGKYRDDEAVELVTQLKGIKREMLEGEMALWDKIEAVLTPSETLEFIQFYERFQKDVMRRVRLLQQERRGGLRRR